MFGFFKRKPVPVPYITIPDCCIECGRGCNDRDQSQCALVHAEQQEHTQRREHEEQADDTARGHDGLYA